MPDDEKPGTSVCDRSAKVHDSEGASSMGADRRILGRRFSPVVMTMRALICERDYATAGRTASSRIVPQRNARASVTSVS